MREVDAPDPMTTRPWESVQSVPPLEPGEVHVWRDDLSAPAPEPWASLASLTPDERTRADRISAVARRAAYVRGRSALRFLAGEYLNVNASMIPVRILESGKPIIDQQDPNGGLSVSVSHSGSVLAVAFTRAGDIGIDVEVEAASVDRAAVARRFFSNAEAAGLARLPPAVQLAAFFALWVRKEALLKAIGDGLSTPLAEVEFTVPLTSDPTLVQLPSAYGDIAEWTVRGVAPAPGTAGAVAVRGRVTGVCCLTWETSKTGGR